MQVTRSPKLAPYLLVSDAASFIRFLETTLEGKLTFIVNNEKGAISHAEVAISDSLIMLAETPEGHPNFPAMLHYYVPDAEASYKRALSHGATSIRVPTVAPDGDCRGGVKDRWGNEWWFSTPGKAE